MSNIFYVIAFMVQLHLNTTVTGDRHWTLDRIAGTDQHRAIIFSIIYLTITWI